MAKIYWLEEGVVKMSPYSMYEICNGCTKAIIHDECCYSFCKCEDGKEKSVDYVKGICLFREEEEIIL